MTREYPNRPWVGVGIVIWRRDKVLLIRRGRPPRKGEWGIPGGAQAVGETIFETAIREAREEAGVTIRPRAVITAVDSISRDDAGRIEFHYTIVEVAAEWIAGEAVAASDAAEARWATLGEAEGLVKWDETRRVITEAAKLRDRSISGSR